jgi:hypothetical protein
MSADTFTQLLAEACYRESEQRLYLDTGRRRWATPGELQRLIDPTSSPPPPWT